MDALPPPPLHVTRWFNTREPVTLESLRGRVVVVHAFQMLCPACVSHGLPQAAKLHRTFAEHDVAVIGLHTVFEHHAVMGADALQAFIHEYRLSFPIGIDEADPGGGSIPRTMAAWGLQGTPSVLVFDRDGRLCFERFGAVDDLVLGVVVGQLLAQPGTTQVLATGPDDEGIDDPDACDDAGCPAPPPRSA